MKTFCKMERNGKEIGKGKIMPAIIWLIAKPSSSIFPELAALHIVKFCVKNMSLADVRTGSICHELDCDIVTTHRYD